MSLSKNTTRMAGVIGNLLEHYDGALFGLLAPFIAPLFFGDSDPLTALIMTYAIIPLGLITKPLGSLFFGFMGDRIGRKEALIISLTGMAFVTLLMGCLPTYQTLGPWAPCLLALLRLLQSFFSAGEVVGAAIYILEHTKPAKRSLINGFFDASSVLGMISASLCITFLTTHHLIEHAWRVLFWLGAAPAFWSLYIRAKTEEGFEYAQLDSKAPMPLWQILKEHQSILTSIILASGFTYMTYSLAFTLMNGYIPLVTRFTQADVIKLNTGLLIIDMIALPIFGWIASKFGKTKVMLTAALLLSVGAIPLFYLLQNGSYTNIVIARVYIVLCGVGFAASYFAWALEQVAPRYRYTMIALSGAIGSQLIGAPTAAICLGLHKYFPWPAAPGLYILLVSLGAIYAILKLESPKTITITS